MPAARNLSKNTKKNQNAAKKSDFFACVVVFFGFSQT